MHCAAQFRAPLVRLCLRFLYLRWVVYLVLQSLCLYLMPLFQILLDNLRDSV